MDTTQQVIKYCAIAFAIFLIVGIFTGISYAVVGIFTATEMIGDNSTVDSKCENAEERCLQINLSISPLNIRKGEEFKVETKNDKVEVKEDGKSIIISEKGRHLFESYQDRDVTVYIPEDTEFEKVAVSGGVSSIYVESLRAKNLEMSLGIGETKIDAIEIEDAKISTGIGKLSVNLMSKAEDYEINVSKGIGDITLNDKSIPDHSVEGSGSRKLTISGGIGSVQIKTAANN